ncbi:MAG: efflux RND transporter periplasmic adaptor subunit [Flavisolibacter sp.]
MTRFGIYITLLVLISCGSKQTTTVETAHEEEEQTRFVTLTAEQMKTAGIELGTIESKNLQTSVKANGVLSVPNQNKALVTSVNSGVIKTLLIQPGSYVRKGQTIATLINPDVAGLQQQLQTTNAQINLAEIELKRQQELVEGNAAPLKNVQRVQTELATLRATRNALQKQLATMGISPASVSRGNIITTLAIPAPISGTIANISAQIGSNVDASTPIAEIVNNSQLHLDLFVYEKDLHRLHENQTIHFTLTNNPGKEYDAKIYSIGSSFASDSKTVAVHAVVLGDKSGLIEGMNITAAISLGESVVPAVPNEAIVSYQGQNYIFVLTDDGTKTTKKDSTETQGEAVGMTFERVQVVKGVSDIGFTEVTPVKIISPNSRIITRGAFFANAKMTNTEGHED